MVRVINYHEGMRVFNLKAFLRGHEMYNFQKLSGTTLVFPCFVFCRVLYFYFIDMRSNV
jgi:hypothetical protein